MIITTSCFIKRTYVFLSNRFRSDHNEDNTIEILHTWLYKNSQSYHHIDVEYKDDEGRRPSEISPTHWPDERHVDVIAMKEEALQYARKIWADYVFVRFASKKNYFLFLSKKFLFICFSFWILMRS